MGDDPAFFEQPDPWGYRTNPDDKRRKQLILHCLAMFTPYSRALDIGAHEGWITQDLPCNVRHGYELSDLAASRFPVGVERVHTILGGYDLVVATGVLYAHYEWQLFTQMIQKHATRIVLTCNIKPWEVPEAIARIPGKELYTMEFQYREWTQKLRVFQI